MLEVTFEGDHAVTIVRNSNVLQQGYRSFNLVGREESEDTEHGQTPVVHFRESSARLLLFRTILGEAEGIEQVKGKVDIVSEGLQAGILPRHPSLRVVRDSLKVGHFVPYFQESDEGEDLPLGRLRDGIPLLLGR